jgi:predicted dehydrogenase
MSESGDLRVAVVGVGPDGIGRTHVRLLGGWPDAALVGICDVSPAAFDGIETKVPYYLDYELMLGEARPDAVILATPPASHARLTQSAAARGIHVFAEKPMAESAGSAREMIAACRKAGVTLMIGQKKRFVPALARLKDLLESDLGPPQCVVYRYIHPWRSEKDWFWSETDGGGPLRENAVHAADLLRWLCGEPDRIQGEGDYFTFEDRKPQLNCALATIRFLSGAIASLATGMVGTTAFPNEELFVTTARGVAEVAGPFDNPRSLRWALRGNREALTETFEGDPFRRELEHFFRCVRTGETPLTDGEEGLKSLELCERWRKEICRPES